LNCGGYGVFFLGHCHPVVLTAVRQQLEQHPLSTRLLINPQLAAAATALASVTPDGLDHVFLTNSGAEAVELGLKLARLSGKRRVIALEDGYHGKTLGALSVTGRTKYREPFTPLLPDVEFVPFGDTQALDRAFDRTSDRACVILEPVQAEGGVRLPPPGYLREVRERCTAYDATMILDEIQTGMGRLGTWWGADTESVIPDILLVGKTLSGGIMPVGATVTSAQLFDPLNNDPLLHSSTFAGNPLAAAAAAATVTVIQQERLVERAQRLGEILLETVRQTMLTYCPSLVREVRGRGLLIGIEFFLGQTTVEFMIAMLERRVITSYSLNSHTVLRLTPPAILTQEDLDWLATALHEAARELGRQSRRRPVKQSDDQCGR
jgi:putrescine aminotransferase